MADQLIDLHTLSLQRIRFVLLLFHMQVLKKRLLEE